MPPVQRAIPVALLLAGILAAGLLAAEEASPPGVERLPDEATPVASPGYESIEDYCTTEDERDAFTVFVARLEGPGANAQTYRFPVSHQVQRLRVDDTAEVEAIPLCINHYRMVIGDNPFSGTGSMVGVNVIDVSRKGVKVQVNGSWTARDGPDVNIKSDLFFPWRTSACRRLAPDVMVIGWFEKPGRRPAPADASSTRAREKP
jgi:hypothetical protein